MWAVRGRLGTMQLASKHIQLRFDVPLPIGELTVMFLLAYVSAIYARGRCRLHDVSDYLYPYSNDIRFVVCTTYLLDC